MAGERLLLAVFAVPAAVLALFLLVPLAALVATAPPGALLASLSDPEVLRSLALTFGAALAASTAALGLGVPLAWLLARRSFPGRRLLEAALELPVLLPHTAAGVALLLVFGRQAPAGSLLHALGVHFTGSAMGIACAMGFVSAPYLIKAARDAFASIDPALERAARTLGAGPWQCLWLLVLPLAARGIATGFVHMWARGVSEFGAVVVVAYHPMVLPVLLWDRFETRGLQAAQPLAAVLVLIGVVLFAAVQLVASRIAVAPPPDRPAAAPGRP